MQKFIFFILTSFFFFACKKEDKNNCNSGVNTGVTFDILETVVDTILPTDTVYAQTGTFFKAGNNTYASKWKIGYDERTFTTSVVNLIFNEPGTLNVSLNANYKDDCLSENKTVSRSLVVLKNDGSLISPIAGSYHGYNTDKPNDTFSISVKFWIGSKYNWWLNGAYTIQNLPRGYVDSLKEINGTPCPEITGIICGNGYKNLQFDKSGDVLASGIKGYASLRQGNKDTIVINYKLFDIDKFNQNGEIKYLEKKYIGFRF